MGIFTHENLALVRYVFQTRGQIDGIAHYRIVLAPLGTDQSSDDVARADTNVNPQRLSQRQRRSGVELFQRLPHGQSGTDSAFRIIFVSTGRSKHRHDGVSNVFIYSAFVTIDTIA